MVFCDHTFQEGTYSIGVAPLREEGGIKLSFLSDSSNTYECEPSRTSMSAILALERGKDGREGRGFTACNLEAEIWQEEQQEEEFDRVLWVNGSMGEVGLTIAIYILNLAR